MLRVYFNSQFIFLFVFSLFIAKGYKGARQFTRPTLPTRVSLLALTRRGVEKGSYAPAGAR